MKPIPVEGLNMRGLAVSLLFVLTACQQGASSPEGPGTSSAGFTGIGPGETIIFGGTEPFWGGEVVGDELRYSTPEDSIGTKIVVARFTGQGGISFSGKLGSDSFDLMVTAGKCSDGMSDRIYPYTVTLQIGSEQREGCAHTDRQPYSGPDRP